MAVSDQMQKKTIVTDAELWRCHLGGEDGVASAPACKAAKAEVWVVFLYKYLQSKWGTGRSDRA
jgi:hypothetical protein